MNIFKFIRKSLTKDAAEKDKGTQKDSQTQKLNTVSKPKKQELYQDNEDLGFC